jgi:hypothetical protein
MDDLDPTPMEDTQVPKKNTTPPRDMNGPELVALETKLGRPLTQLERSALIPVPTKLDRWMTRKKWSNSRLVAETVRLDPRTDGRGVCERTVARLRAGANLPTVEVAVLILSASKGELNLADLMPPEYRKLYQGLAA